MKEIAENHALEWQLPLLYYFLFTQNESESEVAQWCLTLCHLMDCSLPGFSVHWIFQARVLEWVAISFSRGPSWPMDRTQIACIVWRRFTLWATREAPSIHPEYFLIFTLPPLFFAFIWQRRTIPFLPPKVFQMVFSHPYICVCKSSSFSYTITLILSTK